MTAQQWLQIIAALIGGGAAGAIINSLVTTYRNRVQPIGYKTEVIQVFRDKAGFSALQAQLKVSDGNADYHFDNLFIARVMVINKGNTDIAEFPLGITLANGDKAIFVQTNCSDRHHTATLLPPVSLNCQTGEIDIQLRPFNRLDVYAFEIFIVTRSGQAFPGGIQLSSPRPVRFVPLLSSAEVTANVAVEVAKAFFGRV